MEYFYKIVVEPQEEGGYTAFVPKLPGCVSEGETYDETMVNIKEAIELYLETLNDLNTTMPIDDTRIADICVSI